MTLRATQLGKLTPGTVLATRTVAHHLPGVTLPLRARPILYRTADQLGRPVAGFAGEGIATVVTRARNATA